MTVGKRDKLGKREEERVGIAVLKGEAELGRSGFMLEGVVSLGRGGGKKGEEAGRGARGAGGRGREIGAVRRGRGAGGGATKGRRGGVDCGGSEWVQAMWQKGWGPWGLQASGQKEFQAFCPLSGQKEFLKIFTNNAIGAKGQSRKEKSMISARKIVAAKACLQNGNWLAGYWYEDFGQKAMDIPGIATSFPWNGGRCSGENGRGRTVRVKGGNGQGEGEGWRRKNQRNRA
eukprot:621371-Pleurochrysis_carterae.AAC.1